MPILQTENISYTYAPGTAFKHTAVNDISLSVNKGCITGIIGHTGSGKSTLLQLLNGLLKPTEGKVIFDGKDIWENPKKIGTYRFKIGLVFQYPEYQLFEDTVREDISYGPKNMKLTEDEIDTRVKEAASLVQLKDTLMEKSPFELSGGEKRRVAIAGIMAMKPEVIVFDEPTAGLDPIGRETVFKAIKDYRDKYNATIIIVSHSMEDMANICDNLLVMNDGKIVASGSVAQVFGNSEFLRKIGLNVPDITSVMLLLKESFPNINANVFTVEAAANALLDYIKDGEADAE